jgi:hypothetical protein
MSIHRDYNRIGRVGETEKDLNIFYLKQIKLNSFNVCFLFYVNIASFPRGFDF